MPRPIVTPWLRSIYESAAAPNSATPSDGACIPGGNHAVGTVAPILTGEGG